MHDDNQMLFDLEKKFWQSIVDEVHEQGKWRCAMHTETPVETQTS